MKAAIYVRVSTIDKGQTVEQQEQDLINFCKKEGWEYELFQEFASGAKESRPELDKMMQRIRKHEFDVIMIYRLDRLGRSLKHLLQLVEEFKNLKVRFICYSQNMDTSTAQGMLLLGILGTIAEFERTLIRERTVEKLSYLKSKGTKLGRPAGSKDKKVRRKSGYLLRWQDEKWKLPK